MLEGDSLTIIKALSTDQRSLYSFSPLIDDAKFSSVNFDQLHYSHVKRECNFTAHRELSLLAIFWIFKCG